MTQRTYFEEDGPVWEWWRNDMPARRPARDEIPLVDGYSLQDIDELARIAMSRTYGRTILSRAQCYEAARDGVVDALLAGAADRQDLIAAGSRSLASAHGSYRQTHGLTDAGTVGPRFATWWRGETEPWTDRLHDRMALHDVWADLGETERDQLTAMVLCGNRAAAADQFAVSYGTFVTALRRARAAALALWFDGETPPAGLLKERGRRPGKKTEACSRGHEWTPENTSWYRSRPGGAECRRCKTCEKDRYRARRVKGLRT